MTKKTLENRTPLTTPNIEEAADWLDTFRPRLRTCLFGHPHPAKLKPMEETSHCPLGQWLDNEDTTKLSTEQLKALHEELHAHAREILRAARRGEKALAARLLEPGMPLVETISRTQKALNTYRGKTVLAEA